MELFDTHCHLDFKHYDDDRAEVLARARARGVQHILIPGVDEASIRRAQPLVAADANLWMAVGIHPNSSAHWHESQVAQLREWAAAAKVRAIGEIGLDYYWDRAPKESQRRAFEDQLALAASLELPVIIHNREASADLLPILESWAASLPPSLKERPGVLHSFSAPQEYAERALAIGFYLGFTGPITYKNADDLRRIAAMVPAGQLLIETDGPFLSPQQHRGRRNEPAYVALVADRLAALRGLSVEEIAAQTTRNGLRLFAIDAARPSTS